MVDVLLWRYLVVPPSPNSTVKINVAWTENDFQLDIADPGNRTIYKRIIDRAADFGITHILFAPVNSDVSDRYRHYPRAAAGLERGLACVLAWRGALT